MPRRVRKRRHGQLLKEYEEKVKAIREGKLSWEEFRKWWDATYGITGTGPIVQKMLEAKWALWDSLRKESESS